MFVGIALKIWIVFAFCKVTVNAGGCSRDYSPCTCNNAGQLDSVTCNNVPVADIKSTFAKFTDKFEIHTLILSPQTSDRANFPSNLLGNVAVNSVTFSCPQNGSVKLQIDSKAFTYGSLIKYPSAAQFVAVNCDFALQKDFSFLTGYKGWALYMHYNKNIQGFKILPPLTGLMELIITQNSGLGDVADAVGFPDLSPARIRWFTISDADGLTDCQMKKVLDKVASSSSAGSIEGIWLWNNRLTKVPPQVKSFPRLLELELNGKNSIKTLTDGPLTLTSPNFLNLRLDGVGLTTIEPGAFSRASSYRYSKVFLNNNKLTTFESEVFKIMLEQMITGGGYLQLYGNIFECNPCDMKWLIKDNRHLLPAIQGGMCANKLGFNKLDFSTTAFSKCPSNGGSASPDNKSVFKCYGKPDGIYANAESKSTYWICNDGEKSLGKCTPECPSSPQMEFDPDTKRCFFNPPLPINKCSTK